jgi:hypothetical protein
MNETTKRKEREKKLYYVITLKGKCDDADMSDVDVSALANRRELNAWLTGAGARTHRDPLRGGQCWLELDDGRECLIIQGALRAIKNIERVIRKVSVV